MMGLISRLLGWDVEKPEVKRVATEAEIINAWTRQDAAFDVKMAIEESSDPEVGDWYVRGVARRALQYSARSHGNKYTGEMLEILMGEIELQIGELNQNCPEWARQLEQPRYPTRDWFPTMLYEEVTD